MTGRDPAIEAAQRLVDRYGDLAELPMDQNDLIAAAREMAKPIREQMAVIKQHYSEIEDLMLAADTGALTSRYANEMAGIKYAYDLIARLIYPSEELNR